jgi:hypothetical protein
MEGQSLAEYALIVALVVLVSLLMLALFGTQISDIPSGSSPWGRIAGWARKWRAGSSAYSTKR